MQNSLPPRRRKRRRRIWPWIVAILVFLAAVGLGAFFASSNLLDKNDESANGMMKAHNKTTIMIMGVDERDNDVGRSDTLMIAAVDPKKDQASLLSVPRDTRVKIKGHGWDKINAAYAYGGYKLSRSTVENLLGMQVDHYILINIKAFTRIIDAIGGVDIDVEKRMYYTDPWDDDGGLVIDLKPGEQHMDGKTAVTYVRYRDEEGDIGRIARQQKFMKAVMDKLTSPSIIPRLPSVIKEVMGSIKTDLSFRQLLELADTLNDAKKNGLKTDMVPGKPLYIDGVSYWIPDVKKLRSTIADTLGVHMSKSMMKELDRQSSEYENSIPEGATAVPSSDTSIGKMDTYESEKGRSSGKSHKSHDTSSKRRQTPDTGGATDTAPSTDTDSDYGHHGTEGYSTYNTGRGGASAPERNGPSGPAANDGGKTQ